MLMTAEGISVEKFEVDNVQDAVDLAFNFTDGVLHLQFQLRAHSYGRYGIGDARTLTPT
jgi:hypothetical protein